MVNMDLRQTQQYAGFMSKAGWLVEQMKDGQYVYIRKIGVLGSIIKIQRFEWPIDLEEVKELAKKYRAWLVKLEPKLKLTETTNNKQLTTNFRVHGFKLDRWPLIPPSTLVLDLDKSEKDLLASFSENARRNLRKAQGVLKVKLGDWEWFYENWKKAAGKQRLVIPSKQHFQALVESFGDQLKLISCVGKDGLWLGGIVLVMTKNIGYYYYATASVKGKELGSAYLATWTALQLAKEAGCRWFDFDGVVDERYKVTRDAAWKGFTEFKLKFGGEKVQYVGSFIKYYGFGWMLGILDRIFN